MPGVARRERIYQGELAGPDGARLFGELWTNGTIAIIFRAPWRSSESLIRDPVLGVTEHGRLTISGTDDGTGEPVTWEATAAETTRLNWTAVTVRFPDGAVWTEATVQVTQYRVKVLKYGETTREFVGAVAEQVGNRRVVTTFAGDEIVVEVKKGCGCGGS